MSHQGCNKIPVFRSCFELVHSLDTIFHEKSSSVDPSLCTNIPNKDLTESTCDKYFIRSRLICKCRSHEVYSRLQGDNRRQIWVLCIIIIFIIIIYPLTARVVGVPQMISQPVFSNFRSVHSLMLSSPIFLCLPCLLPPFAVPSKMVSARPDERET